MVLLSVESENGTSLTYRLGKAQITVGSSNRNDVVVRAPGLADRHLVIYRNGDVYTFVTSDRQTVVLNGERRARGVLNPGDKLRIGGATLVFRGSAEEAVDVETVAAPDADEDVSTESVGGRGMRVRPDPAGFAEVRSGLVELFGEARRDRLQRLIALLRDAAPDTDVAIVAPGEGEFPVPLASYWSGDLPRLERRWLADLTVPGRVAILEGAAGQVVLVPILTPQHELAAMILARPVGSLGDEGVGLLGEVARHLGIRWQEVERDDTTFTGWELEARHRLEALFPGSSQAVQILRAGIIAAAHGNEPVLVCGGAGVGRTEVARVLAMLGPVGGRPVVVFEGRNADVEALRAELYGEGGHATLAGTVGGLIGRAQGGALVLRNFDRAPETLQTELAALISAQQRERLTASTIRWVVTCDEDPLALVQKGRLAPALFMVFAQRMLRVPRLSERREDLPLLIASLMRRAAADQRKSLRGITLECLNALLARPFPGELAELVGEVNRLVTATPDGDMIRCEGLIAPAAAAGLAAPAPTSQLLDIVASDNLKEMVPAIEQLVIDRVMQRVKGNQSEGARILGISRGALIAKLKEYGIPDYRYLRRRRVKGL